MMNQSTYSVTEVDENSRQYGPPSLSLSYSAFNNTESLFDVIADEALMTPPSVLSQEFSEQPMQIEKNEHELVFDFISPSQSNHSSQNTMASMMNMEGEVSRSGETIPAQKLKSNKRKQISKQQKAAPKRSENLNRNSENQNKQNCQSKNFPLFLVSMIKRVQRRFKQKLVRGKSEHHSQQYVLFSSFFWEGLKSSRSLRSIKQYLICSNLEEEIILLKKFNELLTEKEVSTIPNARLKELQKQAMNQIIKQEDIILGQASLQKIAQEKLPKFHNYVNNFLQNLKKNQINLYTKSNDL